MYVNPVPPLAALPSRGTTPALTPHCFRHGIGKLLTDGVLDLEI